MRNERRGRKCEGKQDQRKEKMREKDGRKSTGWETERERRKEGEKSMKIKSEEKREKGEWVLKKREIHSAEVSFP